MHIPDGFLSTPVWAGLAAVSAPSVGILARRAQAGLEESRVPLMGVMGAFVFAAQMINFPVGVGASGHLVGGALLAIALGPAAAVIVMTAILAIQALVFQDGGLLALGANVFNMALAGVLAGYLPYHLLSGTRARGAGVFLGGFLSVFVSACLCLGQLALSGVPMPGQVLVLAVGVFTITAALEGAITLAVVGALEKLHPNWRRESPREGRGFLALLGLAALLLASAGFFLASALPDGLERVAGLVGLEGKEQSIFSSPLPDYEALMLSNPWLRSAGAGLVGVGLTLVTCLLLGRGIVRWRKG
jgi:cobalt/nickel transport system permease protein